MYGDGFQESVLPDKQKENTNGEEIVIIHKKRKEKLSKQEIIELAEDE